MPKLRTETFGTGDQSWLGDASQLYKARTAVLDISTFLSTTYYPNGYIPSGTPVAFVGGMLVPYDKTEATTVNAGVLAGFLLTDQSVSSDGKDFAVPYIDDGRVNVSKVPYQPGLAGTFAKPAAAAKVADVTIVFNP